MKQVYFPINHLEGFIKFCELAELNIMEQTIDNLTQDACVSVLINGKYTDSIDKAKEKYLIYNSTIISIYGTFDNTYHGIKRLFDIKECNDKNELSKLQDISKLSDFLNYLT